MNTTALLTAFVMTKADGLNLQKTIDALRLLMIQAWSKQQKDFLSRVIGLTELSGAGALSLTAGELERIQTEAGIMFGINFREAIRPGSVLLSQRAFDIGYRAAVNASLRLPNLEAVNIVNDDFLFWVGKAYDQNFSGDMAALMDRYFKSGATKAQLVEAFKEHFSATKNLTDSKWGLLADTNITRTAEIGHLAGYEDVGVEYAQIVAVLDDRTSDICRHLHGRKIPISAMARQRDGILDASKRHDIAGIKRFQPMAHGDSFFEMTRTSDLIADEGVGMPPYHFRCRTTTVAYSEPAEYHEKVRQMAYDGEVSTKEAVRLVGFAKNTRWGTHKKIWQGREYQTALYHYKKHKSHVKAASWAEYNEAAMDLIRRGGREVYLVIREKQNPYPVLYFYKRTTKELTLVNVKGQNIASYYKKDPDFINRLLKKSEAVIKLDGGITKWIKHTFL